MMKETQEHKTQKPESHKTKQAKNDHRNRNSGRLGRSRNHSKLAEKKRQFVLEWFSDPEVKSIEDFCADAQQRNIRDGKGNDGCSSGVHRRFLVRAVSDLDLLALREVRGSDDGMDGKVKSLLATYCPRKHAKGHKHLVADDNSDGDESKKDGTVDMDETKRLMIEFFDDPTMKPLHAFLKEQGFLNHKKQFVQLAPLVRLRYLRTRREKDGVRDKVVNGVNKLTQEDLKCKNVPKAALKWQKGKCAVSMSDVDHVKSLLVEYADHCLTNDKNESHKGKECKNDCFLPPRAFLCQKGMTSPSIQRRLFLRLAKKLNLEEVRNEVDTAHDERESIRENLVAKIESITTLAEAMQVIKSKPNRKVYSRRREVSKDDKEETDVASQSMSTMAFDLDELKSLLIDFFNDEDKTALVPFLEARDVPDRRGVLLHLIRKIHLRRLRKDRDVGSQEVALAKICALTEDDLDVPKARIVPMAANDKGLNRRAEPLSFESKKELLIAFFDDEDKTDLNTFLCHWSASHEKKSIIGLMRCIGLCRLRKKRDDPGVRSSVMEAIANLAEDDIADFGNVRKKKHFRAGLDSCKVYSPDDVDVDDDNDDVTEIKDEEMGEKLKKLLVDWFFDEDMACIALFLRRKKEMALLGRMQNLVKVCGLRNVRKNRDDPAVKERVMMKIGALFVADSPFVDESNDGKQKVKKPVRPNKMENSNKKHMRETFDTLLQEWCNEHDEKKDNLSFEEFLEEKGMSDAKEGIELRMKNLMKKELSRAHRKVSKKNRNEDVTDLLSADQHGGGEFESVDDDVNMDESGPMKAKMGTLKLAE